VETLGRRFSALFLVAGSVLAPSVSHALTAEDRADALQYLKTAESEFKAKDFFKSARYAFAAMEHDPRLKPRAYAWVTQGLIGAGLPQSATYFFIRTLQLQDKAAVRSVLNQTQYLLMIVGPDILRKYLIRHTTYNDYDAVNRGAYLYSVAKEAVLGGDYVKAIGYLNNISSNSALYPFALHLRGTAYAIQGRNTEAISDFRQCSARSGDIVQGVGNQRQRRRSAEREADDLKSRCLAGIARTFYQADNLEAADRAYDAIPIQSFVLPDILFEMAWNYFGQGEYNRTLGKLVSYKSPALNFMYNSEIDVLRAQAFLNLCLYDDTGAVINEFNSKYTQLGVDVKSLVENNANNLPVFYALGKQVFRASLYTSNPLHKMMNRFIRSPYFQNLVSSEKQVATERIAFARYDAMQTGVSHNLTLGFPGFLDQVLSWRLRTIRLLGGAFVKNSLMDYHAALVSDFEKMSFIKLEMLRRAKENLMSKQAGTEKGSETRERGNVDPTPRDDQYKWSFNGEFWVDEFSYYVFGLPSQCQDKP
jgi:tetratricopeptide (TPR) repeat protein